MLLWLLQLSAMLEGMLLRYLLRYAQRRLKLGFHWFSVDPCV